MRRREEAALGVGSSMNFLQYVAIDHFLQQARFWARKARRICRRVDYHYRFDAWESGAAVPSDEAYATLCLCRGWRGEQ